MIRDQCVNVGIIKKRECNHDRRSNMYCRQQREFEAERGIISCLIGDINVVDAAYDLIPHYDAIKKSQDVYDLMWVNEVLTPFVDGGVYEKENTEKDV